MVNTEGQVLPETSLGFPNSYGICGLETYNGRRYEIGQKTSHGSLQNIPLSPCNLANFHFELHQDHIFRLLATESLTKGEQIPYHYGCCSNRFLLIIYGFCLPVYPADVLALILLLGGQDKIILLHRNGSQTLFLEAIKLSLEEQGLSGTDQGIMYYALAMI